MSRDTTLGGLAEADLTKLCRSAQDYLLAKPIVLEGLCKVSGAVTVGLESLAGTLTTDEAVQMSCAKGYDQCRATFASDGGPMRSSCMKSSTSCMATVAEYETCVTDTTATFQAYATRVPACKDMKLSDIRPADAGIVEPIESPASCKALQAKCPELFGSPPQG